MSEEPEPQPVTLQPFEVAALRRYLARAHDFEGSTAEKRADARTELCGYLTSALDLRETR